MAPSNHRASKRLAWALRHGAAELGLSPDASGWVAVPALLHALRGRGMALDEPALERVVTEDPKSRYELEGGRVRARYGHSYEVEPGPTQTPPERLYHGTAASTVDVVLREGLRPMRRAFVHLSETPAQARSVGARHGRPVVLLVDAAAAVAAGVAFHSASGTWLAREVPARHLTRLDDGPAGSARS